MLRQNDDLASVADQQLAAFVDRILRMREEERAIKADIREIYAEAKANGHDKTVMGKLVNYLEKRSTAAADLQEAEALFDLYLTAYDRATGRIGTAVATHTHEADEHDADGVIIEPSLRNPQTTEPATSDPSGVAADAEGSDEPSLPSAIQSTAARKDVHVGKMAAGDRALSPSEATAPPETLGHASAKPAGTQAPPVDTPMQEGSEPIEAHNLESAGSTPAPATPSTPDKSGASGLAPAPVTSTQPQVDSGTVADEAAVSGESAGGENVDAAADSAGGRDSSPAVASNIIKIGSGKPLRPFCLHLDDLTKCGGYGKQHCGPCLKAHADAEGLTA